LQTQVSQLREQQKGQLDQQRQLDAIAAKIPGDPQLPALIRQLSAAAKTANVDLVSLSPGPPTFVVPTGPTLAARTSAASHSPGPAGNAATAPTAPASQLAQIPLQLQITGSYSNIEQFFLAVESLNRAMLVSGLTIAPANGAAGGVSGAGAATTSAASTSATTLPGTLSAQITAAVFMSPQAVAAAVSPLTTTAK
jgi:Tfp pilus assembly protein PilO